MEDSQITADVAQTTTMVEVDADRDDSREVAVPSHVLNALVERVDDLEASVSHLSEENADLKHEQKSMKQQIDRLSDDYADLKESYDDLSGRVDELESEVTVLTSRLNHVDGDLTDVEDDLADTREDIESDQEKLSRRLAACEDELGLDEWDIASSLGPNASPLERWAEWPEEMREEKLGTNEYRALLVWEHFDEWADTVRRGKLIPSGELKQLLSARIRDTLEYTQVYRVMDEFEANAPDNYEYIDNDSVGKALLKER